MTEQTIALHIMSNLRNKKIEECHLTYQAPVKNIMYAQILLAGDSCNVAITMYGMRKMTTSMARPTAPSAIPTGELYCSYAIESLGLATAKLKIPIAP